MSEENNQKFKYFVAKGLEVKQDGNGKRTLTVPIQSTMQDRDGDTITEEGQQAILNQLASGKVPAFPNHGLGDSIAMYDFREIMGKWVGGYTQDEKTYGTLQLREGSSPSEELVDLVEQDMPVGFSVGFIPKECEEDEEGMKISDLELLEVSPVGIPSNAAAVQGNTMEVAMAAKSAIENNSSQEDIQNALKGYVKKSDKQEMDKEVIESQLKEHQRQIQELREITEGVAKGLRKMLRKQDGWSIKNPKYDVAQKEQWETPSMEDFQNEDDYYAVHMLWASSSPESTEDVSLPVARPEGEELVLVLEALESAWDFAPQVEGLSEDQVENLRDKLESLREKEFPDEDPLGSEEEEDGKSHTGDTMTEEEGKQYEEQSKDASETEEQPQEQSEKQEQPEEQPQEGEKSGEDAEESDEKQEDGEKSEEEEGEAPEQDSEDGKSAGKTIKTPDSESYKDEPGDSQKDPQKLDEGMGYPVRF